MQREENDKLLTNKPDIKSKFPFMGKIIGGTNDQNEAIFRTNVVSITKNNSEALLETFKLDVKSFQNLFDNQSIKDRTSLGCLEKMGYHRNIAVSIKTDVSNGLNERNKEDLTWRKKTFGSNISLVKEPKGLLFFIVDCLRDQMLQLLLIASLVSLIIGIIENGLETGWIEGTAIFFAVFIVVSITAFNNLKKEEQFIKLSQENNKKKVQVIRNSKEKDIDVDDLLVGDILKISWGNIIPVDGIMIEGSVEVDESAMNGESDLIKKAPYVAKSNLGTSSCPFCVSGTSVKSGEGKILVLCVGVHSQMGITKSMLNIEENQTPLQVKLGNLADTIGDFGFYSAALIMIAIVIKEIIIRIFNGRAIFSSSLFDVILNSIIIGITVIVVAIPEGLPMAVTISLAYSVFKMKADHNLVRRLEAAETMGGVDQICSDKTGTITEGTMTLVDVFIDESTYSLEDFKSKGPVEKIKNKEILYKSMKLNNDALLDKGEATGNMTDVAMIQFLINTKVDCEEIEAKNKKIYKLPFRSEYKFMATLTSDKEAKQYTLFLKGAPEVFLDSGRISKYLVKEAEKDFNDEAYISLRRIQEKYANQCFRTILLLKKNISEDEIEGYKDNDFNNWDKDDKLRNLTIIAMVAIADPVRKNVTESISILTKQSKITVRMVTGDNINTAIAISEKVGILTKDEARKAINYTENNKKSKKKLQKLESKISEKVEEENKLIENRELSHLLVEIQKETSKLKQQKAALIESMKKFEGGIYALEGTDFRILSGGCYEVIEEDTKVNNNSKEDNEEGKEKQKKFKLKDRQAFELVTKNLKVISRASPEDKFLLVIGLKELKSVVAVTGDGTNDAPALRASDVGFAMGKRGTDIAKDACHIVLLSESFDSIVSAVKYGRNVFDCIRKFLQFQLTANIVAVFMTLLGSIVLKDSPLNAIQMLWLNLIMDSFGSLALATEDPKQELLNRKPYKREENVITHTMMFNIVCQAIFQILVLTIILFYGDTMFNVPSDRELSHFEWNDVNGYHFTIFFQIFVLMQVFNSINARKLKKDELNVFADIMENNLYIMIQVAILICQFSIVSFGGRALRVKHLSLYQHLLCIIISFLCVPFGMICKKLPFSLEAEEIQIKNEDEVKISTELPTSIRKSIRKSKTLNIAQSNNPYKPSFPSTQN